MIRSASRSALWLGLASLGAPVLAQLNQNCTVSVLNRTVPVGADGRWVLPNVPANFGQVKARATCVQNGTTIFGESAFFTIPANGAVNLPEIILGSATLIPSSLTIAPSTISFNSAGQTVQLAVTATYPNGTTRNVTAASTGTNYTISNPAIATITAGGLITAVSSGTVVIQANNDGATAIVTASVVLGATGPGGIALSWLVANGLNPNDPLVAMLDPDRDNLTHLQEFQTGTNPNNADTDGDGLKDGEEVTRQTSPLLADTDGDLIPDGVEVQTGTNPRSSASYDVARAAATSTVTPPSFTLNTSFANPVVSVQLTWSVALIDGKTTLDLTADPRTSYSSNDLNICNFGQQPGRIFSGSAGNCVITLRNNTLSATVPGSVSGFSPTEVSAVNVSGATAVDVAGGFAYVAAGNNGVTVVDIADKTQPRIRGTRGGLGNAQHVRAVGQMVYVADSTGFLRIVNAQNPAAPTLAGSLAITGSPTALAVRGTTVAVAAQAGGVSLVNVSNPSSPALLSTLATPAPASGVDFDAQSGVAVIAMGTGGLQVANFSNLTAPQLRGRLTGGDVRRVFLKLPAALLADAQRSITAVNISNPDNPVLSSSVPADLGGSPVDIAGMGDIAMTADVSFGRAVPIVSTSNPLNPSSLGYWNLGSAGFSSSIALDLSHGYLIIPATSTLRILKYQDIVDTGGRPPTVQITFPTTSTTLIRDQTITMRVSATDDVAVASVNLLVDGRNIATTSAEPYQTSYTVPVSATTLTFGATAVDFGNNLGVAQNVTVPVIADPLTTATGRVVASGGNPVSGATVSALGRSATSGTNGTFTLAGLPTIRGPIQVLAVANVNNVTVSGLSAAREPVAGGVTNAGDILVLPKPLISSIKSRYALRGTVMTGFTVTGANLTNATFSLLPVTTPQPIMFTVVSVSPAGDSANLTLDVAPDASGEFALVATTAAGTSDASPQNTITFIDAASDPDGDSLSNTQEVNLGTDPFRADTDGDGWPDGMEVTLGSNPLNASSVPVFSQFVEPWVTFGLLNRAAPFLTIPTPSEVVATIALLNRAAPFLTTAQAQEVFAAFALLNQAAPFLTAPATHEAVGVFTLLNRLSPSAGAPFQIEANLLFSLSNLFGASQSTASGTAFEWAKYRARMEATPFTDQDGNGLPDWFDELICGRPGCASLNDDTDGDGLSNLEEFRLGTDPRQRDTDFDGLSDGEEVSRSTHPLNPDTDGDGYGDGDEVRAGTNPLDPGSFPKLPPSGVTIEVQGPLFSIHNLAPPTGSGAGPNQ